MKQQQEVSRMTQCPTQYGLTIVVSMQPQKEMKIKEKGKLINMLIIYVIYNYLHSSKLYVYTITNLINIKYLKNVLK